MFEGIKEAASRALGPSAREVQERERKRHHNMWSSWQSGSRPVRWFTHLDNPGALKRSRTTFLMEWLSRREVDQAAVRGDIASTPTKRRIPKQSVLQALGGLVLNGRAPRGLPRTLLLHREVEVQGKARVKGVTETLTTRPMSDPLPSACACSPSSSSLLSPRFQGAHPGSTETPSIPVGWPGRSSAERGIARWHRRRHEAMTK